MTKPQRENKLKERLADAKNVQRAPAAEMFEEDASVTLQAPAETNHAAASEPHVVGRVDAGVRRTLAVEHFEDRMQRYTTYVDRDVLLRMQSFARRTGIARARIVTEGISMFLREYGEG